MAKNKPKSAMGAFLDKSLNANLQETEKVDTEVLDVAIPIRENIFESNATKKIISDAGQSSHLELITVHPDDCIPWKYADRQSNEMGDIDKLSESMKQFGQQQPILVRTNTRDTGHKYEVIFGNRRWQAAQKATMLLTAVQKNLSDQDAGIVQKHENENRAEISDYSRALNYKSLIDGRVFESEKALADHMGMSKQTMNDIMAFLRVPKELRDRIYKYSNLSKSFVSKLATLSKDKDKLEILLHLAPEISSNKVTTSNLESKITNYMRNKPFHVETTKLFKNDSKGRLIYEIKTMPNGKINVSISKTQASNLDIELLNAKLIDLIDNCKIKQ